MTEIRVKALSRPPAWSAGRYPFWPLMAALLLGLTALLLAALAFGSVALPIEQIWAGLTRPAAEAPLAHHLVWRLRLPRSLLALMVGAQFALSGLLLQTVIRNPLADPGVMGVSAGASLFVVGFILWLDALKLVASAQAHFELSIGMLPFVAIAGAVSTALLLLGLSWRHRLHPLRMALYGVALGAMLNAAVMWVVVGWGGGRTEITLLWLSGSLYGRDVEHIAVLLPWLGVGVLGVVVVLRPLAVLRFDDDMARSLGLAVRRWRLAAVLVAVVFAASAVAVAGPVGFVGLVVPHLARQLVGGELRFLAPASAVCGAGLMLAADLMGRVLFAPLELPAGALTTLIGVPVFLTLLQRQSGRCP